MMWLEHNNTLITSSKDRSLKFWKIPESWTNKILDQFAEAEYKQYKDGESMMRIQKKYTRVDESDDELDGWDL